MYNRWSCHSGWWRWWCDLGRWLACGQDVCLISQSRERKRSSHTMYAREETRLIRGRSPLKDGNAAMNIRGNFSYVRREWWGWWSCIWLLWRVKVLYTSTPHKSKLSSSSQKQWQREATSYCCDDVEGPSGSWRHRGCCHRNWRVQPYRSCMKSNRNRVKGWV